jgi:hypothetical protein
MARNVVIRDGKARKDVLGSFQRLWDESRPLPAWRIWGGGKMPKVAIGNSSRKYVSAQAKVTCFREDGDYNSVMTGTCA